jgi:pimeloyl-ACP methyl ester carboxylesterase/DNA-binding CsgD family transcriptional regulator
MDQKIRFVTASDGVRIASASMGSGYPLVKAPNWLSHVGMDGDSPVWRHWWAEFARDHRFIRLDQRGCGLSDRSVGDVSFARWVGDLESVVDAHDLQRFDLVGMSQGGAVAVDYAARHPGRVRRLVIIGGYLRGWAKRDEGQDEHRALLTLIKAGWGSDNPAYRQIFTQQFMPDATPEQMAWFNDLERASSSADNALRFQIAVGDIDVAESAARISVPTLISHSLYDARVPIDQGRQLAALIPDAHFIALDSKNHILLEEEMAWRAFVSELRSFLSENPDAGVSAALTPPAGGAHGLSGRELEVLRLVASGKTDRQVADELSLSARTVGNHLKHIFDKTGSTNRTAAVMWAAKRGLVS